MGINIERHCQFFTHLYIELVEAVFTKDRENASTGILPRDFDNEILRLP